jgi:hypothetical protein
MPKIWPLNPQRMRFSRISLGILPGLEERPKIAMDWGLNNLSIVLPTWQFITYNTNGRMIRIFYHFFVIVIRDISKSVTFVIKK